MRYKTLVVSLAVVVVVPAVARATVVLPLDFKALAERAAVIAHGRVVALSPQWATDRHGIDTIVTVRVASYLKGDMGAQLTFRVPGGKIGRLRSVRLGAPVFHEGEEVVVFLTAAGPAFPRVVGFNQGVYRVNVDESSGARTVMMPMLAGEVTAPTPIVRGDPSRKPMPLAQFEARVRSVLEHGGDGRARDRIDPSRRRRGLR